MVSRVSIMLLGLLMEGDRHGYELVKEMDERGMSRWAPVSKVAAYKCLARMESEGSLTSWLEREGSAPEKHVYAVTQAGEERLRDMVYALCSAREPLRFESNAALPFLQYLEKEDAIDALENRLHYIEGQGRRLKNEADMLEGLRDDIFLEVLKHEEEVYRQEVRFLKRLIALLKPAEEGKRMR
jgi:DNA-binding PadR family transcriptional regulator